MADVRYDDDDELDELVCETPVGVHLERLDEGQWWLGITTADGKRISVTLSARSPSVTKVTGTFREEE